MQGQANANVYLVDAEEVNQIEVFNSSLKLYIVYSFYQAVKLAMKMMKIVSIFVM